MKRHSGLCAAVVKSFESFCAAGSTRHLVVALRSDVGSPCVHLWMLVVRQVCVCVWTVLVLGPSPLSRCGGGERCSVSRQGS